jgi:hypothetical protein
MNFSKACIYLYQILSFDLQIYYNLKSYQNILITLGFSFLYHKLQPLFICHVHPIYMW